jgi:cytochrome c
MRFVIAAAAALAAGPALAQDDAALVEQGMTLFQQNCRTCHVVKEGENRLGPSLYGVVGREVGTVEGFSYSNSLASSGETWTEEHLDTYLQDPDGLYPGTRMLFAGLPDEEARSAIIAYLKSEGGSAEDEDTGS